MNEYWFKAFYTDRDGWTITFKYSVKATTLREAAFKSEDIEKHFEKENLWLHNFNKERSELEGVDVL